MKPRLIDIIRAACKGFCTAVGASVVFERVQRGEKEGRGRVLGQESGRRT